MRGRTAVVLTLFAVLTGSCRSDDPPAPPQSPPSVAVTMRDDVFVVEGPVSAGRVVVDLSNVGTSEHQLTMVSLARDVPPLAEQLRGTERRGAPSIVSVVLPPGGTTRFALDLEAGRYGLLCFTRDAEGVQRAFKGMNAEVFVE